MKIKNVWNHQPEVLYNFKCKIWVVEQQKNVVETFSESRPLTKKLWSLLHLSIYWRAKYIPGGRTCIDDHSPIVQEMNNLRMKPSPNPITLQLNYLKIPVACGHSN